MIPLGVMGSAHRGAATPGSYPDGLDLWLAADTIIGVADGAPIATWPDLSGKGNHAGVFGSRELPTLATGALNGMPVARFYGNKRAMLSASLANLAKQTIIIVSKVFAGASHVLLAGDNTGGLQSQVNETGKLELLRQWQASIAVGSQTLPFDTWGVCSITFDNGVAYRLSGGLGALDPVPFSGTIVTGTARQTVIGTEHKGDKPHNGEIAEIAKWSRVLSTPELTAVITGLQEKWGIS